MSQAIFKRRYSKSSLDHAYNSKEVNKLLSILKKKKYHEQVTGKKWERVFVKTFSNIMLDEFTVWLPKYCDSSFDQREKMNEKVSFGFVCIFIKLCNNY